MLEQSEKSEAEEQANQSRPGVGSLFRDRFLAATILAVVAVDQLTKYIVSSNLDLGVSWPARGWFRFTHGSNSGTAFGLFPNQTFVLILASIVAIGFLYFFYRSHARHRVLLRFAIALQLGGAVGNLIDRVKSGAVVDFIDIGPWPIFNLADSAIVVGITLLVVLVYFSGREPSSARVGAGSFTDPPAGGDGDGQ